MTRPTPLRVLAGAVAVPPLITPAALVPRVEVVLLSAVGLLALAVVVAIGREHPLRVLPAAAAVSALAVAALEAPGSVPGSAVVAVALLLVGHLVLVDAADAGTVRVLRVQVPSLAVGAVAALTVAAVAALPALPWVPVALGGLLALGLSYRLATAALRARDDERGRV